MHAETSSDPQHTKLSPTTKTDPLQQVAGMLGCVHTRLNEIQLIEIQPIEIQLDEINLLALHLNEMKDSRGTAQKRSQAQHASTARAMQPDQLRVCSYDRALDAGVGVPGLS